MCKDHVRLSVRPSVTWCWVLNRLTDCYEIRRGGFFFTDICKSTREVREKRCGDSRALLQDLN